MLHSGKEGVAVKGVATSLDSVRPGVDSERESPSDVRTTIPSLKADDITCEDGSDKNGVAANDDDNDVVSTYEETEMELMVTALRDRELWETAGDATEEGDSAVM